MGTFYDLALFVGKWLALIILTLILAYLFGRTAGAGVMRSINEARGKPPTRRKPNG